ncbi:hypothetical protein EVG20_g5664 [Dentipellis fragilis]|uniref:Zn(2)-C6 fungal-type domain-containing protein n=1 Tax=Dentipellis fragilis TaxID=205917 RepID=A0A4Y9YVS7_9AGAM|nr:hypothetical protein EVG20_g5664 [Dentipellis fragilis]
MASQNTYSELSDDDASLERRSPDEISRRRSTRACDQCRRTKSKCQRFGSDDGPCRGCMTAGISCTFAGPSHKRGPPKGYIHAIERRLHQVEALMGTIVGSADPRAKSLLRDLSQDPLARQIIHRVDHGPFGPKGRVSHPFGSTKEDFLASIMGSASPASPSSGTRRSRRARDSSSAQDDVDLDLISPNNTWQTRLQDMLASGELSGPDRPRLAGRRVDSSPSSMSSRSIPGSVSDELGTPSEDSFQLSLPSSFSVSTPVRDTNSIGLDLTWDRSPSSRPRLGVGMKSSSSTGDLGHSQIHPYETVNGNLVPSPRQTLIASQTLEPVLVNVLPPQRLDVGIPMTNSSLEAHLIGVYFEFVHPLFPILCKDTVLDLYNDRNGSPSSTLDRTTGASIAYDFLLLSMFSLAARFTNSVAIFTEPQDSRNQYYESARKLMYTAMDNHCLFNCQALLLLTYCDIGTGSTNRAWNHIGMAMRMCHNLGLHQTVARPGAELSKEMHTQRRVALGCSVLEKHVSALLGRTAGVDTPYDHPSPLAGAAYQQETGDRLADSCFEWAYSLSLIVGTVLEQVYSRSTPDDALGKRVVDANNALSHWYTSLPQSLAFVPGQGSAPSPCVLQLHAQYWSTAIILHQSLVYNCSSSPSSSEDREDAVTNALDLSITAAHNILATITSWDTQYPLSNTSPLISECLLNAGYALLFLASANRIAYGTSLLFSKTFTKACARQEAGRRTARVLPALMPPLSAEDRGTPPSHISSSLSSTLLSPLGLTRAPPSTSSTRSGPGDMKSSETPTIRQKRSAQDPLNADARRMRPIPTALKQSPLLHVGPLNITNDPTMAGPSYSGIDVSPRDTFGAYRWENGMDYTFPDQGLISFTAGQTEWSAAGINPEALDFVTGL